MRNFPLAAQACALGAVTGWPAGAKAELRDAVRVPDDCVLAVLVAAGVASRAHGRERRLPVADVAARAVKPVAQPGSPSSVTARSGQARTARRASSSWAAAMVPSPMLAP
jgi:hypothetical protein